MFVVASSCKSHIHEIQQLIVFIFIETSDKNDTIVE